MFLNFKGTLAGMCSPQLEAPCLTFLSLEHLTVSHHTKTSHICIQDLHLVPPGTDPSLYFKTLLITLLYIHVQAIRQVLPYKNLSHYSGVFLKLQVCVPGLDTKQISGTCLRLTLELF